MAFTGAEKVSIRRHLGLNSASQAWYPYLDTFFVVDDILTTVSTDAENEGRTILVRLTNLESALDSAIIRLTASAVGSIKLNDNEIRRLRGEIGRWRRELSTLLGVPMHQRAGQITVV